MPGRYIGRMQCSGCQGWEQEHKEQEHKDREQNEEEQEQNEKEQEQNEEEQGEQENEPPLMTREHIQECPGFAFLRAGKELIDPKEQSEFFITVMKFRSMR